MQWQKIGKGSLIGCLIAYVTIGIFQSTDSMSGVWVISFPLGAFVGGYLAGDKAGGVICGVIIDGTLLVYASLLLHEGSLAGIILFLFWILLMAPLSLIGLAGGYVALRRSKAPTMEQRRFQLEDTRTKLLEAQQPRENRRTKFCLECGAEVARDAKFCPFCDALL